LRNINSKQTGLIIYLFALTGREQASGYHYSVWSKKNKNSSINLVERVECLC